MSEQRWLSLTGICSTLQTTPKHALWLAKQGYIGVLWGRGSMKIKESRFLDPTPEFAVKLQTTEAMYGRLWPIPKDLSLTGLLTAQEISVVSGMSLSYTKKAIKRAGLVPVKMGTKANRFMAGTNVFSVKDVRDFLWRRQDRKKGVKRNPFLLAEIIDYFLKHHAAESEEVPTDSMFKDDDLLMRKLDRLTRMKDPKALKDFYDKVALAKSVSDSIRASSSAALSSQ